VNTKTFSRTGAKVTEIGMGTYYDPLWIATATLGWRRNARRRIMAIRAGIEVGINLIDTAEIYGSEPLVGEAINDHKREDLFIATKVWPRHARRDALVRSLEKSLARMGISYVDLYQIHFPSSKVPIGETMAAMEEMKEKGKLLSIGVSNFSLQQTIDANAALKKSQLASTQMEYSLVHRNIEADILPYCENNGMAILAYYPLGHGRLAKAGDKMRTLCEKYAKTPSQVALNWLTSKPNVFPIPRASRAEHVTENAGGSGWTMSGDDRAELEKLFPR
jgi:diketogulonate reductase-like aldo/keto reductase